MYKQNLTPHLALQKIKQYCAYQERSHFETKNKLFEYGLKPSEVDNILATLIEENFLNEERFATLFAGGKFRIKHWGKVKIKYELQQHKVSIYNIKKALQQIDEDEYLQALEKICKKYYTPLKGKQIEKNYKTKTYLQQKGFELDLINQTLKKIVV
ncbi:MAG: regulatory protein RecX [Bacteroidetes bacterium]|nr:regulatory protein RecX [Bacteroidota bacterium]